MSKYIDRELIEKEIAEFKKRSNFENDDYFTGYMCALSYIEGVIGCQPIVDVAPVIHGNWHSKYDNDEFLDCTNCGYVIFHNGKTPYCPNCGAKMDGKCDEQND